MKRIGFVALLIAMVPLLSSCYLIVAGMVPSCDPHTVNFDQRDPDPIFRGTWTGTVSNYPNQGEDTPLTKWTSKRSFSRQVHISMPESATGRTIAGGNRRRPELAGHEHAAVVAWGMPPETTELRLGARQTRK